MSTSTNADISYNPSSNPAVDAAEYCDETALGDRGADRLPTSVNAEQEDAAATGSEDTRRVSKDEVEELIGGTSEEERSKTGTRGVYKQEAALSALDIPVAPAKRTRADADGSPPPSIPPTISQVKCERSPSPLPVQKRLVTSGTKRFTPIPQNCLPSCAEYRQNRLQWVARCAKELEALNLIPERRLFRDDGLVIDWRSHVPVWSDTLKPNPQPDLAATIVLAHTSNAQWRPSLNHKESPPKSMNAISTQESPLPSPSISVEPPLKKRLPVPPRPSPKHRNSPSQSIHSPPSEPCSPSPHIKRSQVSDKLKRKTHSPSRDRMSNPSDRVSIPPDSLSRNGQVGAPSKISSIARDKSVLYGSPSAAEEEMSDMTLEYLRRYVQTYESDRASLASAYASNASFGYRIQHTVQSTSGESSPVWATSPQCFSTGSKRTRLDIVTTLLTLPSLHLNTPDLGIAQIEYDIFYLGAKHGMFARKEVDAEDATIEGVWPLTAAAHQILVFLT